MGNSNNAMTENLGDTTLTKVADYNHSSEHNQAKGCRFLCLHGWRTSGTILRFQTTAMRANTGIEGYFVNFPFPASGPPDEGIKKFYANFEYYEWCTTLPDGGQCIEDIEKSVQFIIDYIQKMDHLMVFWDSRRERQWQLE